MASQHIRDNINVIRNFRQKCKFFLMYTAYPIQRLNIKIRNTIIRSYVQECHIYRAGVFNNNLRVIKSTWPQIIISFTQLRILKTSFLKSNIRCTSYCSQ